MELFVLNPVGLKSCSYLNNICPFFSYGHCIVGFPSIYGFWLPLNGIFKLFLMQYWPQALEFRTPLFLIWFIPRLWYGSLSGSITLSHLSIFYNISCYISFVLLTFVSRSSCRITYIYIKVWNNRQNTKRESSLRLDILQ